MRQSILVLLGLASLCTWLTGCASWADVQERYVICSYDHVWEAALDALKDRSVKVQGKETGYIQTDWLEIPMPGRTFGAFQREMADSKDRSRVSLTLKRLNDVISVSLLEERERWAFRGGSRMFGWAPTDPSAEMMATIQNRIERKLKEHGCSFS